MEQKRQKLWQLLTLQNLVAPCKIASFLPSGSQWTLFSQRNFLAWKINGFVPCFVVSIGPECQITAFALAIFSTFQLMFLYYYHLVYYFKVSVWSVFMVNYSFLKSLIWSSCGILLVEMCNKRFLSINVISQTGVSPKLVAWFNS